MNTKNNQLYIKTSRKIVEAILNLMEHTEFEKITVKTICATAHVNHSTFYAHFNNIYDLIEHVEQNLQNQLLETYEKADISVMDTLSTETFLPLLEHVYKHKYFYRVNLLNRKVLPLSRGCEVLWKNYIEPYLKQNTNITGHQLPYNYTYFHAGFIILLQKWVDTDCKETIKEFAEIVINCIVLQV